MHHNIIVIKVVVNNKLGETIGTICAMELQIGSAIKLNLS